MKTETITDEEAEVLAHTARTGRYVTGDKAVLAMAERGLLFDHGARVVLGGAHYLVLTLKGRAALQAWREAQPKEPEVKLTKRQRRAKARYQRFREFGDCFSGFRGFLLWDVEQCRKERLGIY